MISMNLIFHLFSAILAFVLVWFVVQLRSDLKFTKLLLLGAKSGSGSAKVFVDSPYHFLKRLSGIMNIHLEDEQYDEVESPLVKIDGSFILRYCLDCGVTSIKIKNLESKQMGLEFSVTHAPGTDRVKKSDAKDQLSAAFGGKINIELNIIQKVGV